MGYEGIIQQTHRQLTFKGDTQEYQYTRTVPSSSPAHFIGPLTVCGLWTYILRTVASWAQEHPTSSTQDLVPALVEVSRCKVAFCCL